mmetsp:Transcript_7100/g.11901  ORF Transcript_7100/g.11901 Transcript_7100/m.11901 type:complete len:297 (-) Transcript_7100:663-1553(-)
MYLAKSAAFKYSDTFSRTYSPVISKVAPSAESAASNDNSSMTRSTTVCRRRAPIFSTVRLTSLEMRAISLTASSVKVRARLSAFMSSTCCFNKLFTGSVRMRCRSSSVKPFRFTRIGIRPCSSGNRSEGFTEWKDPAAMKRINSVLTFPRLVLTIVPSIIGRKSRWTPSAEASDPLASPCDTILSISSTTIMPDSSTALIASFWMSTCSISFSDSSSSSTSRASLTSIFFFSIPCLDMLDTRFMRSAAAGAMMFTSNPSMPVFLGLGIGTSTSTRRLSKLPSLSKTRKFSSSAGSE